MMLYRSSSRRGQNVKGFTLTEAALTLGIMGTVLGAVWVAAGSLTKAANVRAASSDTMALVENVRGLYSGATSQLTGVTGVAVGADLTAKMISSGVFPTSAVNAAGTKASNVWGGNVSVLGGSATNVIRIQYDGIPSQDACLQYVISFLGAPGVTAVGMGYTSVKTSTGYLTPASVLTNAATVCPTPTTATVKTYTGAVEFSVWNSAN